MLSARSARITAGSGMVLSDAAGHADVRTGTLFLSITGLSQPLLWTRLRRNRSISSIRGAGSCPSAVSAAIFTVRSVRIMILLKGRRKVPER